MPTSVTIVIVTIAGYLLGSIPFANLVARRSGASDLRRLGDRNPGYWNAREQIGALAATPVFVADVAKGSAAALVGVALAGDGQWGMGYVGGGAAMVGHAWPVFAGFAGGRSVLTFVGTAIVVAPVPAFLALGVLGVVWSGSRSFAWAARAGVAAFPVAQLAIQGPHRTAATGVLMTFIGIRFATAALSDRRRPAA